MNHTIVPLPREQWQDAVLPIGYTTTEYYDVSLEQNADVFHCLSRKSRWRSQSPARRRGTIFPIGCLLRIGRAHAPGESSKTASCWAPSSCVQRSGRTDCVSPSFGWTRRCKSRAMGTR